MCSEISAMSGICTDAGVSNPRFEANSDDCIQDNAIDIDPECEYVINKPGRLVIFNFNEIDNFDKRCGTQKDVDDLHRIFTDLEFEIKDVFHDLPKDEVIKELKNS